MDWIWQKRRRSTASRRTRWVYIFIFITVWNCSNAKDGAQDDDSTRGSATYAGSGDSTLGDASVDEATNTGTEGKKGANDERAGDLPCKVDYFPEFDDLADPERIYTAENYTGISAIELSSDSLIFFDGSKLYRLLLASLTPVQICHTEGNSRSLDVILNETHAFFWTDNQFVRVPIDGVDAPLEVVIEDSSTNVLAVDADRIYVFNSKDDSIEAVPVSGGASETVIESPTHPYLWLHDGFFYYIRPVPYSYNWITRRPMIGGEEELVVKAYDPTAVSLDSDTMFFADDYGLKRFTLGSQQSEEIIMDTLPIDFAVVPSLQRLEVFGSRVYWISDTISTGWVNINGTECSGTVILGGAIEDVAVDEDYTYFTYKDDVYRISN